MTTSRFTLLSFILFFCFVAANAQSNKRNIEPEPDRVIQPRLRRFVVATGVGLLPSFFRNGTPEGPIIQGHASYFLTPRLAVGVSFGKSKSTGEPFIDGREVKSFLTSDITHVGARLTGCAVRTGPFELYGGLQVGMNATKATIRHEFPATGIEDEEAYIAARPSPFGEARSQLSATGFMGVSLEVLPHLHGNVELGNNLSILTAGVEVRF